MSDYIKRSELIMHLSDWAFTEAPLKDDHDQNVKYDTIQTCIEAVERMKSADVVERKTGKWGDNTKDGGWKCSECGFTSYSVGFYKRYKTKYRRFLRMDL